jgi:DNA-binding NtrC family response regulator
MSAIPSLGSTVLVVEDYDLIAGEIAEAVADLGCTVLGPASSVAEAMRLFAGGWVAAALLDVQLGPLSSSVPLAAALRTGGVPFAVISGYEQRDLAAEPVWQGVPYLAKPFARKQLQKLVIRLLSARSVAAAAGRY